MKEHFRDHSFAAKSKAILESCIEIIEDYQRQGLRLTLRQTYYQLVTRNIIPNVEKSYKMLSGLLSDARLAGLIDWRAIEDRIRVPRMASEWSDLDGLVESALAAYRLPRWDTQPNYVELWVEKDALAGILAPIANEYHVPMMVNRGYSSQTAMYDASKRFLNAAETRDERCDDGDSHLAILYLGDLDPSGEDMVRDIHDRLEMFGADVDVRKLALTMAQVKQYKPPPNPAKMTDPRAQKYVDEFGATSWEVDALPPEALDKLIRRALDEAIDDERMEEIKNQEEKDKVLLTSAVKTLRKKKKGG